MAEEGAKAEEALVLEGPKLKDLEKVFSILRAPEETELGEKESWFELHKKVKPFETGLEFTDNVREVVLDFVSKKIPRLQENVASITDLPEKELLEALTHNWFEPIGEKIEQRRKEVLLATAAHIVKRVENVVTRKVISEMDSGDLKKLNLDSATRSLLHEVLETAIKADPMYIRFMAYAQQSGKPPENVSPVALNVPGKKGLHTIAELFPHESQFLAKRFSDLAERGGEWVTASGGEVFLGYLKTLGAFYAEKSPEEAESLQKKIEEQYAELLASDFPILITPATEGYYKEPYYDPELKVSLRTLEAREQEAHWRNMRDSMAESLGVLGEERFADGLRTKEAKSVITVGGFGVNITFNAVAQEKPNILIFLNEQIRSYDKEFPGAVQKWVANTPEIFGENVREEKRKFLETVSRDETVLHEFAHSIFPDDSPEAKRLGGRPCTIIDEIKAEITHRPLVPTLIEKGGLSGTKEEWAIGMLTASLQILLDQPPGDPYYYAAVYALNDLFEKGAAVVEGERIRILDYDKYYDVQKEAAQELLGVYRDEKMTEGKAARWIKNRCVPNEQVEEVLRVVIKKN